MNSINENPAGDAVRLIFTYQHGRVDLISQQRVDMVVSGVDVAHAGQSGDFLEVRDADGAALSRVPIYAGLNSSVEVFPEKADDPIIRRRMPEVKRAYTMVVPARTGAENVAVISIPPTPPGRMGRSGNPAAQFAGRPRAAVTELAAFRLDRSELRSGR